MTEGFKELLRVAEYGTQEEKDLLLTVLLAEKRKRKQARKVK